MIKYYKLLKDIPGGYTKGYLFKLQDNTVNYCWNKLQKKESECWSHDIPLTKDDLEMTEYFEESIGISADGYILFKGDIVYTTKKVMIEVLAKSFTKFTIPLYYKEENIPVEKTLPKSWEDLSYIKGYWITNDSIIEKHSSSFAKESDHKNVFKTESQAKSALVFAQLSQLVAEMNENFIADWDSFNEKVKYCISRENNEIICRNEYYRYNPLAFKNEKLRDFSFEYHKQLWLDYFQLNNNE